MTSVTTTAGLAIDRVFTAPGSDAFEGIEFTTRDARIESSTGKAVFEQLDVEVPASWSQQSTNIVASKYFHGLLGTSERESSAKVLISRVVDTIKEAGSAGGYFDTPESE
jgi:ribonucleoside-diphosphate reductase alpha chain